MNLKVLVVTDGTPSVEAIRQQLTTEGIPITVISLHDSARKAITRAFLARTLPDGGSGGNFEGIVLPSPAPAGLRADEEDALAWYERTFSVRQVDAYSPPRPDPSSADPARRRYPMQASPWLRPHAMSSAVTSVGSTPGPPSKPAAAGKQTAGNA